MNTYKKHLLITNELDWYEKQLHDIMEDLNTTSYSEVKDREGWKEGPKGGSYKTVVATIEQIKKARMDALKELPKLLNALDELRNKYAEKEMLTRGDVDTKNTGLDFAKKIQ